MHHKIIAAFYYTLPPATIKLVDTFTQNVAANSFKKNQALLNSISDAIISALLEIHDNPTSSEKEHELQKRVISKLFYLYEVITFKGVSYPSTKDEQRVFYKEYEHEFEDLKNIFETVAIYRQHNR